ncbi:hypothetical protein [Streptobacillus moniliformis]|uniref:hypothetical protein n=1 Tax=Streptobacillus moniliformis TaxID=34105 RepID=UPI0007E38BBE|nr:hypothetical protein [Streptobacillus moniliformis]
MKTTLTVKECAAFTGLGLNQIRIGLQRKILPFGTAIPSSNGLKFSYHIPIAQVEEYMKKKYE